MKVCVIQPGYGVELQDADKFFAQELALLESLDDTVDIAVMPEACDIPAWAKTREDFLATYPKYQQKILEKAQETAKRCHCMLFINAVSEQPTGLRNTTYAFDREGNLAGQYHKQHLTPGEVSVRKLDSDYTFEPSAPTVITMEGIRFGFLTCYDFYFYEAFSAIARQNVDVIIGCSHQRTDSPDALETMTKFCAYNCNAYVLRASVSMGEDSPVGGTSMIVAPDGKILTELKSEIGVISAEIDPHKKYEKAAGFGGATMAHWQYTEKGRRPWKYRPAGSAIVPYDDVMGYPRVCSHRGFNTVAPENSMPAWGAAVALGAEEIEFDLWYTKDGEIVSIHDSKLDRVSDGEGRVYEHTYEELLQYDFGVKYNERFKGLHILRFEDILRKFAGHTIMNIHIKTVNNDVLYDETLLRKIVDLIDKYDCRRHVYFMCGNDNVLRQLKEMAPDICRCVGAGSRQWEIVDRAIEMGCEKVQLFKGYFNQEMIDKAHAHGIYCNVFWSDDPEETRQYLDMGIDTILTNDYLTIAQTVKDHIRENR